MGRVDIRRLSRGAMGVMVALSVLLVIGCATGDQRTRALTDTLETYQSLIRWGDFGAAFNFLHLDYRPTARELALQMERFEQIQITGYTVISQAPTADQNTVLQTAEISFSNRHTMVVRSIDDAQLWRWDPDLERWLLTTGLPDITRR